MPRLSDWLRQRTFDAKAVIVKSPRKGATLNTNASSPLGDRKRLSVVGDITIISFVRTLLKTRSPFAVIGRVIFAIANALNRELRGWPSPHVAIEILKSKRAKPAPTHLDSAPAIVFVIDCFGIVAALLYRVPDALLWAVAHTMRYFGLPSYFGLQTTTRTGMSSGEIRQQDKHPRRSAFARANNRSPFRGGVKRTFFYDSQAFKFLALGDHLANSHA